MGNAITVKKVFLAFLLLLLFSFLLLSPPQQSDALCPYMSQLLHSPFNNLPLLLLFFFYPVFNDITFSSDSSFYCVFLPFSYVFQNQHISFLKYLDSVFVMLMLQDTLTGLNYSGNTIKNVILVSLHTLSCTHPKFELTWHLPYVCHRWLKSGCHNCWCCLKLPLQQWN